MLDERVEWPRTIELEGKGDGVKFLSFFGVGRNLGAGAPIPGTWLDTDARTALEAFSIWYPGSLIGSTESAAEPSARSISGGQARR